MRYVWLAVKIIIFLILLAFAVNNSQAVELKLLMGYVWELPLIMIILIFFTLGVAFGLAAIAVTMFRLRRDLQAAKRELRAAKQNPERSAPDIEDTLAS